MPLCTHREVGLVVAFAALQAVLYWTLSSQHAAVMTMRSLSPLLPPPPQPCVQNVIPLATAQLCSAVAELFPSRPTGESQLSDILKDLKNSYPDLMTKPYYPTWQDITKLLYFGKSVYDGLPEEDMTWARSAYGSTAARQSSKIATAVVAALGSQPRFMLEVGTFIGSGTIGGWGPLMQRSGGVVLCIDTWLGDINMRLGRQFQKFMHVRNGLPQLGVTFLKRVPFENLTATVLPLALPSLVAARLLSLLPWLIDLVYVDSAHEKGETFVELHLYYHLLRPGGLLLGDDWNVFPAVQEDVNRFASCHGIEVQHPAENTWMLQKPVR